MRSKTCCVTTLRARPEAGLEGSRCSATSGGIAPARAIADYAQSVGLTCTVGSNLEMGVGSAAMTHLAIATRGVDAETYPCDIIGPLFYEDDIVREPLPIVPGSARVNDKPGLGVDLNDEKVERYRVR